MAVIRQIVIPDMKRIPLSFFPPPPVARLPGVSKVAEDKLKRRRRPTSRIASRKRPLTHDKSRLACPLLLNSSPVALFEHSASPFAANPHIIDSPAPRLPAS